MIKQPTRKPSSQSQQDASTPRAGRQARWPLIVGTGLLAGATVIASLVVVTSRGGSGAASTLPQAADYHSLLVTTGTSLPDRLVLGTHEGLFHSTNGGATWTKAGLDGKDAMNLSRADRAIVWAAGHDVLARSIDSGTTWTEVEPEGLPTLDIHGFAVDPSDPTALYAAVAGKGLYRSDDDGSTFSLVSREVGPGVIALAASRNGRLLAADMGRRVLATSDDGGKTWNDIASARVNGLAVNPGGANLILAAADSGVMRSTDGGISWTSALAIESGAGPIAWSRVYPNVAFVVGFDRTLWRSTDFGRTWDAVTNTR